MISTEVFNIRPRKYKENPRKNQRYKRFTSPKAGCLVS